MDVRAAFDLGEILPSPRCATASSARAATVTSGTCAIALEALLPGIRGAFTRFGHTEVLYVTELLGLLLIYLGYRYNISTPGTSPT